MPTSLNVSGTWKTLSKVWINVSGTWKECTKVWLNVGGVWKEVFSAYSILSFGGTVASDDPLSPYNSIAGIQLNTDGTISTTLTPSGTESVGTDWLSGGGTTEAANWSVKATATSGTVSTGTTGSWLALTSARAWTKQQTTIGNTQVVLSLEFSRDGGTTTSSTISVTLDATAGV